MGVGVLCRSGVSQYIRGLTQQLRQVYPKGSLVEGGGGIENVSDIEQSIRLYSRKIRKSNPSAPSTREALLRQPDKRIFLYDRT